MAGAALSAGQLDAMVSVLRNASCQQQPSLIAPAEEQLRLWEKQLGFYHALLQVTVYDVLMSLFVIIHILFVLYFFVWIYIFFFHCRCIRMIHLR